MKGKVSYTEKIYEGDRIKREVLPNGTIKEYDLMGKCRRVIFLSGQIQEYDITGKLIKITRKDGQIEEFNSFGKKYYAESNERTDTPHSGNGKIRLKI